MFQTTNQYGDIWRLPKIGVHGTPKPSIDRWILNYKPSSYWGTTMAMETASQNQMITFLPQKADENLYDMSKSFVDMYLTYNMIFPLCMYIYIYYTDIYIYIYGGGSINGGTPKWLVCKKKTI